MRRADWDEIGRAFAVADPAIILTFLIRAATIEDPVTK